MQLVDPTTETDPRLFEVGIEGVSRLYKGRVLDSNEAPVFFNGCAFDSEFSYIGHWARNA